MAEVSVAGYHAQENKSGTRRYGSRRRNLGILAFVVTIFVVIVPFILSMPPISYKFQWNTIFLIWFIAAIVAFSLGLAGLFLLRPSNYPLGLFVAAMVLLAINLVIMSLWFHEYFNTYLHRGTLTVMLWLHVLLFIVPIIILIIVGISLLWERSSPSPVAMKKYVSSQK